MPCFFYIGSATPGFGSGINGAVGLIAVNGAALKRLHPVKSGAVDCGVNSADRNGPGATVERGTDMGSLPRWFDAKSGPASDWDKRNNSIPPRGIGRSPNPKWQGR